MAYPYLPHGQCPPNPHQTGNVYYSQGGPPPGANPYHTNPYQTNPYASQPGQGYSPQPAGMYSQQGYPQQAPAQQQAQQVQAGQPKGWFAGYYQQISPQEMVGLQNWFNQVDRDRSGSIEVQELQQNDGQIYRAYSLVTFEGRPIGPQAAAKLIQVFDEDRSASIDFTEYCIMHKFISHMRQAFMAADMDRSGRIEAREIHSALQNAGFSYISMSTILELLHKYDTTRLGLDWPQFLIMVSQIAHVRSVFEWNDKNNTGWVNFNRDQLTQIAAFLA